jgi:hypothetical protein
MMPDFALSIGVWKIILSVASVVLAVVGGTYKIITVLRSEIRAEISPIMSRFDDLEKRFLDAVRDLWGHNNSQDIRINAVMKAHYELRGAHDAFLQMGGHKPNHNHEE